MLSLSELIVFLFLFAYAGIYMLRKLTNLRPEDNTDEHRAALARLQEARKAEILYSKNETILKKYKDNAGNYSQPSPKLKALLTLLKMEPHSQKTYEFLKKGLTSNILDYSLESARQLGDFNALKDLLISSPMEMIHQILDAMWKLSGDNTVYELRGCLKSSPSSSLKVQILLWIGKMKHHNLHKLLLSQLKTDNQIVLLTAIQTARALGNPKAIPYLQKIIGKYALQRTAANAAAVIEHLKGLQIEQNPLRGMLTLKNHEESSGQVEISIDPGNLSQTEDKP